MLNEIFEYYGNDNQLEKLAEEAEELAEAARNFKENPTADTKEHLTEEMADLLNVLEQIYDNNIDHELLVNYRMSKIEREVGRIEVQRETAADDQK